MKRLCWLLACTFIPGAGTAVAALSEKDFLEELPVVLSVSRLYQPLDDAPGMVTVIDAETIRATGYRNIPDLLRLVPGFNVAQYRGAWRTVNYHGLAGEFSNRVLVLLDGRPLNSEYFSQGINWGAQPFLIDDVERIEVLSGSNSANHGTNAFLGVVSITTRRKPGGYVRATAGDGGAREGVARWAGKAGPLDVGVSVGALADGGLKNLQDDWHARVFNASVEAQPSAADRLWLAVGEQSSRMSEGYATQVFNPVRDQAHRNGYFQLRWRRNLSDGGEFSLHAYETRDRSADDVVFDLPIGQIPFGVHAHSMRRAVEFQHNMAPARDWRLVWGGELRRDSKTSRVFYGTYDAQKTSTARLFGNVEWRAAKRTTFNAGVMAEQMSLGRTTLSPRLFVNHEVARGDVVRAGISTATRSPTMFEALARMTTTEQGLLLDQLIFGNPDLKPERIKSLELGYFGRLPSRDGYWNARVYEERLSNLIYHNDLPAPPGVRSFGYENLETARMTGVEGRLQFAPVESGFLTLGHAVERLQQRSERLANSAPNNSTSVMWSQRLGNSFDYSVMHYRVGGIHWLNFGDDMGPYRRTDVRLSWRFHDGPWRGEVSLVGINLFDNIREFRHSMPPETHDFSRRLAVTLKLQL